MTVTGKTIAAVIPQIIIAPQLPMSTTDQPSEPSRKPGFARQITNPSYQRSVFRSWRSSTIASATLYLPVVWIGGTQLFGPRSESNTCRRWFQLRKSPSQSRSAVQCDSDGEAAHHDQMRVRRDEERGLRSTLGL